MCFLPQQMYKFVSPKIKEKIFIRNTSQKETVAFKDFQLNDEETPARANLFISYRGKQECFVTVNSFG
jgi:hypothetical protein